MSNRPYVSAGTLWITGAMTAVVAALGGIVTWLIIDLGFGILPVGVAIGTSMLQPIALWQVAAASVIAALAATLLMHLLLLFVPKPLVFFGLISYLVLFLSYVVIIVFETDVPTIIAMCVLNTVVALIIIGILTTASDRVTEPPELRARG